MSENKLKEKNNVSRNNGFSFFTNRNELEELKNKFDKLNKKYDDDMDKYNELYKLVDEYNYKTEKLNKDIKVIHDKLQLISFELEKSNIYEKLKNHDELINDISNIIKNTVFKIT